MGDMTQMLSKIEALSSDADIAGAVASLTTDKDVEVLRTMGVALQLGLTSNNHLGFSPRAPAPPSTYFSSRFVALPHPSLFTLVRSDG